MRPGRFEDFQPAPPDVRSCWTRPDNLCSEDYAKQRFTSYETVKEDEKHLLLAVEGARLHTQSMRNWGYPQHMRRIMRALFEPLEAEIATVVGIGPLFLLDLFEGIRQ